MKLTDFDFNLPKSLIAQYPKKNRTDSRLLVAKSSIIDTKFANIGDFLQKGDLLIMNNTKVIQARLFGLKDSGGKVEIMIERLLGENKVLAMIKASRAPKAGSSIILQDQTKIKVLDKNDNFYTLEFITNSLTKLLDKIGHIPLPPYINRTDDKNDLSRYQTVYAAKNGAVAAPTAGLHFDGDLLKKLQNQGINIAFVTLHVGAGTFQPVKVENIKKHKMHSEFFEINKSAINKIKQTKQNGFRIIAVGTTSVRVLETIAKTGLKPQSGETDIFIYPGFKFKLVDKIITNFHLPKSSLLMLVSAFIGREKMLKIYQHAIDKKYRFFSYGDVMLLKL